MSSVVFGDKNAKKPHLVTGVGGLPGEIADLRADIDEAFTELETGGGLLATDEWTNLVAADPNGFKTSIASSDADVTYSGSALNGVVGEGELVPPRVPTITTTSDADIDAVEVEIVGFVRNKYGKLVAQTDTITLTDGGGATDSATKAFSKITSFTVPAQGGTGGALEFGWGDGVGLSKPIATRAGRLSVIREVVDGVEILTGTKFAETHHKPAVDADPGDPITVTPIGMVKSRAKVLGIYFVPAAALTADNDHYATILVYKYTSAGGSQTLLGSFTSQITGSGDWVAFQPEALTLAAAADLIIAAGSSLAWAITKTGNGVAVPAGKLVILLGDPTSDFASAAGAAPHGTYTPNVAPNASHDYAITYEVAP